ncbi:MAG: bifunctional hydroxymethylpyrimidine kinase/phosphomethylpyrimidine kinase [Clostridiales bacterium]|nr:bifunctional hydroxymethylpyrimidine kinase/phosphomethylpyrimidine kinase [Clostridiales bacterium]
MKYKIALTIAGSDPSGGAGLQADLKTFSAMGVYGASAVVAVVDENTVGVYGVHPIPDTFVAGQIRSVIGDIGTDAVKIGMLHSSQLIHTVLSTLQEYPSVRDIVLDPVMVATSGDPLLEPDAMDTLRDSLIPYCRVITPNLPEASLLLGHKVDQQDQLEDAARELSRQAGGKVSVMLKAGHLALDSDNNIHVLTDVFYNAESGRILRLTSKCVDTRNTHGTGCTLSSAIAACLAKGMPLDDAARTAKEYICAAIETGANYEIGHGHGPVHHFHALWP